MRRIEVWIYSISFNNFELDRYTNNGDLISDRKKTGNTDTHKRTQTQTQIETDILPIYHIGIGSSKKACELKSPADKNNSIPRVL